MHKAYEWSVTDICDLTGKTAVVTGANTGIGYATACTLAKNGADVILASRDVQKSSAAAEKIRKEAPRAHVRYEYLDLGDLASVEAFAARVLESAPCLDILINNAAVLTHSKRALTKDGFEMHMGVNFLGHFALTGLLLPLMQESPEARVVTVSSLVAGLNRTSDCMSEKSYASLTAYGKSKFFNLVFAMELARRLANTSVKSMAVHPGICATNIFKAKTGIIRSAAKHFLSAAALKPIEGAMPALYAATSTNAASGNFYAPARRQDHSWGVASANCRDFMRDEKLAAEVWQIGESLTGVRYTLARLEKCV